MGWFRKRYGKRLDKCLWSPNMTGLDGQKNTPQAMRARVRLLPYKTLVSWHTNWNYYNDHSKNYWTPIATQSRLIKNELKKRGYYEDAHV